MCYMLVCMNAMRLKRKQSCHGAFKTGAFIFSWIRLAVSLIQFTFAGFEREINRERAFRLCFLLLQCSSCLSKAVFKPIIREKWIWEIKCMHIPVAKMGGVPRTVLSQHKCIFTMLITWMRPKLLASYTVTYSNRGTEQCISHTVIHLSRNTYPDIRYLLTYRHCERNRATMKAKTQTNFTLCLMMPLLDSEWNTVGGH